MSELSIVNEDLKELMTPLITKSELSALQGGGSYLPRIQFQSSSSKLCKNGVAPVNSFMLIKQGENVELGKEVDVFVVNYRDKAIDTSAGIYVSTQKDPRFNEIIEKAKTQNSGCMWGPEVLVWLPKQAEFATMLWGSPSARNNASSMTNRHGKMAKLTSKSIHTKTKEGKEFDYWCPICVDSSAPLDPAPTKEQALSAMQMFKVDEVIRNEEDGTVR